MIISKILAKFRDFIYYSFNRGLAFGYDKFLAGGGKIGEGCEVFPDVEFGSEPYLISIGDNVRITYGVKFITHDGGIWTLRNLGLLRNCDLFGEIKIGNNVSIGWNVIIMPGVTIGDNCVIGAGAVVTKSIPDNSVAAGVPARVIESIDEYYEKIKENCFETKMLTWEEKKEFLVKKISENNLNAK